MTGLGKLIACAALIISFPTPALENNNAAPFPSCMAKDSASLDPNDVDAEAYRCYFDVERAKYMAMLDYQKASLDHRARSLNRQLDAESRIFWLVSLLTLTGVVLAAAAVFKKQATDGSNSFELGSLKIQSPVIGLMILSISLVFFYLYLDRVFKIEEIQAATESDFSTGNKQVEPESKNNDAVER